MQRQHRHLHPFPGAIPDWLIAPSSCVPFLMEESKHECCALFLDAHLHACMLDTQKLLHGSALCMTVEHKFNSEWYGVAGMYLHTGASLQDSYRRSLRKAQLAFPLWKALPLMAEPGMNPAGRHRALLQLRVSAARSASLQILSQVRHCIIAAPVERKTASGTSQARRTAMPRIALLSTLCWQDWMGSC